MGKVIVFSIGIAMIIFFGASSCTEKRATIIIQEPTELLQKADIKDAPGNKVLSILGKGMTGKIVDTKYSKDFMFYKIKMEDGRTGYVMHGDNLKVISNH